MTWKELKAAIDKLITDDDEIWYINISDLSDAELIKQPIIIVTARKRS